MSADAKLLVSRAITPGVVQRRINSTLFQRQCLQMLMRPVAPCKWVSFDPQIGQYVSALICSSA